MDGFWSVAEIFSYILPFGQGLKLFEQPLYVCMYNCVYACVYVCVRTRACACVCVCKRMEGSWSVAEVANERYE